jgi:hypothetical protein
MLFYALYFLTLPAPEVILPTAKEFCHPLVSMGNFLIWAGVVVSAAHFVIIKRGQEATSWWTAVEKVLLPFLGTFIVLLIPVLLGLCFPTGQWSPFR